MTRRAPHRAVEGMADYNNTCSWMLLGVDPRTDAAPAVTPAVWACMAALGVDALVWAYAHAARYSAPRSDPAAPPRYGLGGHHVVKMLAVVGALLGAPAPALWFAFRSVNLQLACAAQSGQLAPGAPVLPVLFPALAVMVVAFNAARARLRRSLTRAVPLRDDDRVLLLQCYRGVYATALARRVPRGVVVGADAYGTDLQPESDEWALENCAREGLAAARPGEADASTRVVVASMGAQGYARLPFDDASFDCVVCPFFQRMAWLNDEAEPAALKRRKLVALLRECARVLRPLGRLVATSLLWSVADFAAAAKEAGCFAGVDSQRRWFCLTVVPSRLTVCRVGDAARPQRRAATPAAAAAAAAGNSHGAGAGVPLRWARRQLLAVRVLCCAVLAATMAGVGAATERWWPALQWPQQLPWSNTAASACVGVLWLAPLTLYYLWGALRGYVESAARPTAAGVLRCFARAYGDCIAGLTVLNALLWAPSAAIDVLLLRYAHASERETQAANVALGLLTWFASYRFGRWWLARAAAASARAQAAADDAAAGGGDAGGGAGGEERALLSGVAA